MSDFDIATHESRFAAWPRPRYNAGMNENPYKAPAEASPPVTSMKPIYAFRVVIASVGFIVFVRGILYLFDAVSFAIGLGEPILNRTTYWYAARGVFEMVLGFLLMGGVPQFMRLAFPAEMKEIEGGEVDHDSPISK